MNCMMYNFAVFVGFISLAKVSDGALTEVPSNKVVGIGNNSAVDFRCKSDLKKRPKVGTRKSRYNTEWNQLYSGYRLNESASSYVKVEEELPGEVHLRVNGTVEAAQTYRCLEPQTLQEWSAELIVVTGSVKSEKLVNNSSLSLNCSIEFNGNWAPEIEWTHNGNPLYRGISNSTVPGKMVFSTVDIPRNSNALFAGAYICTAKFTIRGKPQLTNATNVPEYRSSVTLTVEAKDISLDESVVHPTIPVAGRRTQYGTGLLILLCILVLTLLISLDLCITGRKAYVSQAPRTFPTRSSDVNQSASVEKKASLSISKKDIPRTDDPVA